MTSLVLEIAIIGMFLSVGLMNYFATRDRMKDVRRRLFASSAHVYTSTACHHGMHDRCRKECKFCGVKCRCACHEGVPK